MERQKLKNHDLVAVTKEGLTHKQVQKARKDRRLTRNVQDKIIEALSEVVGESYTRTALFNYS